MAPAGVRMVRIDRRSGKRVLDGTATADPRSAIIWEAFKPDTEPPRSTRADEIETRRKEILALLRRGRQAANEGPREAAASGQREDFVEQQGGIY